MVSRADRPVADTTRYATLNPTTPTRQLHQAAIHPKIVSGKDLTGHDRAAPLPFGRSDSGTVAPDSLGSDGDQVQGLQTFRGLSGSHLAVLDPHHSRLFEALERRLDRRELDRGQLVLQLPH
jgi:hypothetical protein